MQPEKIAKEIALSLELFTTGSLDIFGHASNVDLDKRVVVFNIHDLGEQLRLTGYHGYDAQPSHSELEDGQTYPCIY